jgi:hypothetical protein
MDLRVPAESGELKKAIEVDGPHQDGNFSFVEVGCERGQRSCDLWQRAGVWIAFEAYQSAAVYPPGDRWQEGSSEERDPRVVEG